jgi:hypothetical protein
MEDKKKLRLAVVFIVFVLMTTTTVVHFAEGWGWVDSFYFAGVTMATVGYGDLTPHHAFTKIFITFDVLFSVGLFLYSISLIAEMRVKAAAKWEVPVEELPKQIRDAVERIKIKSSWEKMPEHKRRMEEIFVAKEHKAWAEKQMEHHHFGHAFVPIKHVLSNIGEDKQNEETPKDSKSDNKNQGKSKEGASMGGKK